jgi:membrane protease YdiL (CAAX protease family)
MLRFAAGLYGIVTVFALGYALFSGEIGRILGTDYPSVNGLLGALAIAAVLIVLSRVGVQAWTPMRRMADELGTVFGAVTLQQAVLLGVMSGVAEELLFRGALWVHLGIEGTSFLFGLVHIVPRRALWFYPVFATIAGLLLGLLRMGSENVLLCMLAHALVNVFNLAWIGSRVRRGEAPAS